MFTPLSMAQQAEQSKVEEHETLYSWCDSRKEKHQIIKLKDHPTPRPSPGKAMIYLMRKGTWRRTQTYRVALNGKWVAVLDENHYSYFEVEPGPLRFCWDTVPKWANFSFLGWDPEFPSKLSATNFLLLTAEAGRIYYLIPPWKEEITDEEEAQKILSKCQHVTFSVKQ